MKLIDSYSLQVDLSEFDKRVFLALCGMYTVSEEWIAPSDIADTLGRKRTSVIASFKRLQRKDLAKLAGVFAKPSTEGLVLGSLIAREIDEA